MSSDHLVEKHLGLVRSIAGKLLPMAPSGIDFDELIGVGQEALVRAASRYDPDRGVAFVTYAYYRVRGAMLDAMRSARRSGAHSPRLAFEERADSYLEQLGAEPRPATAQEAAARLATALSDLAVCFVASTERVEREPDRSTPDPAEVAERRDLARLVRSEVARLPDKERQLTELVYFEGLGVVEAGGRLGMSKGWASRLHARALARLRGGVTAETTTPAVRV